MVSAVPMRAVNRLSLSNIRKNPAFQPGFLLTVLDDNSARTRGILHPGDAGARFHPAAANFNLNGNPGRNDACQNASKEVHG
jgi:hypothetical protein